MRPISNASQMNARSVTKKIRNTVNGQWRPADDIEAASELRRFLPMPRFPSLRLRSAWMSEYRRYANGAEKSISRNRNCTIALPASPKTKLRCLESGKNVYKNMASVGGQ